MHRLRRALTNRMPSTHALCPYCTTAAPVAWADRARRMSLCDACRAWFVWPRPTAEEVVAHYAGGERGMPRDLRKWREGTSQNGWYDHLAQTIRDRSGADVESAVDVGAGGLELTFALARVFPGARIEAWDLFADGDRRSYGPDENRIALRQIDLNRLDARAVPAKQFDVVACVAVIEHVLDPLSLLRFLRTLIAPGGIAYVVAPDASSVAHRLMGHRWPYYCPDEHLTIPTLESMRRAVALLGGGEYELRRVSVHYSLRYLLRFLRVPLPLPAAADALIPVPAGAFELVWRAGGRSSHSGG
jgi:SAM-dependent methyltransferase